MSRSVLMLFLASFLAPAALAAELELATIDAASGRPVPARVRIRSADGADHVPPGAVEVALRDDRWFVSPGVVRVNLSAGEVEIRVERGKEFLPVKERIRVGGDGVRRHRVALRRWIDMEARGYLNGENHMHVPPADLAAMLAAEDLDYGTSLHWWNGPKLPLPEGPEWVRQLSFGGAAVPASVFDAEIEYEWGPAYMIGMRSALAIPSDAGTPNFVYLREGRRQGALLCYNGGWARETLFDALAGLVDVVDVCSNLFLRHRFLPRKGYSNVLGVDGFPSYPETPEGMLQLNLESYYRLLNCGLRLAAGADSAVGAKATPAGYNRSYVRGRKGAPLSEFLESWRAGRNFVTNGPMLFLEADGLGPGDVKDLPKPGARVRLSARAVSNEPLGSLELVVSGETVARAGIEAGARSARLSHTVTLNESSWIAARCTDREMLLTDEELGRYRRPPGRPAEEPSRLRFAHTSPIYLTLAGKPVRVGKSVEEARRVLEAFERFSKAKAGERYQAELLSLLEAARARLR